MAQQPRPTDKSLLPFRVKYASQLDHAPHQSLASTIGLLLRNLKLGKSGLRICLKEGASFCQTDFYRVCFDAHHQHNFSVTSMHTYLFKKSSHVQ
eukprot:5384190-Amphidinium_carterae.1